MAVYFVSDTHFGLNYNNTPSKIRERKFIEWLDNVAVDADEIYLLGDIFDFWFEYKRVVPKGFTGILAKFSELTGKGIKVKFFVGNHDLWTFGYLESECGIEVFKKPEIVEIYGFKLFLHHGDGLGKTDFKYKLLRSIFHSKTAYKLFSTFVHPNLAMQFGHWWSESSRRSRPVKHIFDFNNEPILRFVRDFKDRCGNNIDYFVIGHLHVGIEHSIDDHSKLFVLGQWIDSMTYGRLDEDGFRLLNL